MCGKVAEIYYLQQKTASKNQDVPLWVPLSKKHLSLSTMHGGSESLPQQHHSIYVILEQLMKHF